jgi:hypothetical protein
MANLSSDPFGVDLATLRRSQRRSAHAQQARAMLVVACLSAVGMIAVAATLLTNMV